MSKRIIIFSHGFGVKKDARGLFTDLGQALKPAEVVLFDYNEINEKENILTVKPIDEQVKILQSVIDKVIFANPEAVLDIIGHSMGSIVASLINPTGIRKFIFLAPPFATKNNKLLDIFRGRPGAIVDLEGESKLPRRDGSVTIVPKEFWQSRDILAPVELYNKLAEIADLTIINAKQDEVLESFDQSQISQKIHVIEVNGGHDFVGSNRIELIAKINDIILK